MIEYIIIGDTDDHEGFLVAICRGMNKESAEKVLNRMLTHPTKNDLHLMGNMKNFRLEAVAEEDQWWNDPFLMSD